MLGIFPAEMSKYDKMVLLFLIKNDTRLFTVYSDVLGKIIEVKDAWGICIKRVFYPGICDC